MKFRVLALAAALFSIVFAGCSAVSVPGAGGGSSSGTGSLKTQQDEIVLVFRSSLSDILEAKAILLEALGKKNESDLLIATAKQLKSGNTDEGDLKSAMDTDGAVTNAIKEALAKADMLDAEKAAIAKQAVLPFISGNVKMASSLVAASSFLKDTTQAIRNNPMSAAKLKSEFAVGIYVASTMPPYVKANAEVISITIDLLKKSGIDTGDMEKANKEAADAGPQD